MTSEERQISDLAAELQAEKEAHDETKEQLRIVTDAMNYIYKIASQF
jgi:hypothetical protein